jgi:NADH-quinone oxidoreductase subunit A
MPARRLIRVNGGRMARATVHATRCLPASRRACVRRPRSMNPYVLLILYFVGILGFVGFTLFLNRVLGPKPVPTAGKLDPFECGVPVTTPVRVSAVPVKYYAVAVLFILFDLETVFLFVWALGAQPLTGFMLFTLFLFAFLLVLILLYVYRARLVEAVIE